MTPFPAFMTCATSNVETLELTLEQLGALPQVTIVTENEFSDGESL